MIPRKLPLKKESFRVSSFTLTKPAETILKRLSENATDIIGRSISESAIIRALLCEVAKRGSWATDALFLEVEGEMNAGLLWGRTKKS